MTVRDRFLARLATGPMGRFAAFWLDLGAALAVSLRRHVRPSVRRD
jgi:hypothetical protein